MDAYSCSIGDSVLALGAKEWYNVSMRTHTILFITFLFFAPFTAFATGSAPTNVQGVATSVSPRGSLTVTWNQATDPKGIAFYRVYWSHQSILGNGGDYDDFERTTGPETTFTFTTNPLAGKTVFIGVLAVNVDGVESEGFEMEASTIVPLVASDTPASSASMVTTISSRPSPVVASAPATNVTPPLFTAITPVSSTGVLLTFSKTMRVDQSTTPFTIRDASGAILLTQELTVSGSTILVVTAQQAPLRLYNLFLTSSLVADDGGVLQPIATPLLFYGFPRALESGARASSMNIARPVTITSSSIAAQAASQRQEVDPPDLSENTVDLINIAEAAESHADRLPDSGIGIIELMIAAGAMAMMRVRRDPAR